MQYGDVASENHSNQPRLYFLTYFSAAQELHGPDLGRAFLVFQAIPEGFVAICMFIGLFHVSQLYKIRNM
jgi:hypothetical protein